MTEKEKQKEEEVKEEKKEGKVSEEPEKKETTEKKDEKRRPRPAQMPSPTFPQLVDTFFFQTMISLGKQMNPLSQKYERDLPIAQYQIGILELLQEKTKGNLSKDEDEHLDGILHTVRIAYIDEANKEEKK